MTTQSYKYRRFTFEADIPNIYISLFERFIVSVLYHKIGYTFYDVLK